MTGLVQFHPDQMKIFDYAIYLILRAFFFFISHLPVRWAIAILTLMIKAFMAIAPKFKRIAMQNLTLAFPDQSPVFREKVYADSCQSLARLVLDFARLHRVDEEWARRHVEIPRQNEVDRILGVAGRKSAIYVTGHLGSFELLAHAANLLGYPQSFIVRNFKNPYIDRWWNSRRQFQGNIVINRVGAFKEVIRTLESGKDVGILFDQNVTRKYAFFVDFFGKRAATTKTVGVAAVRTEAIIIVVSMKYLGNDKYRINWEHRDFIDLYRNPSLSADEKAIKITQEVSTIYENMIRADPGAWFWMHRRWRTRPEGEMEDLYSPASCIIEYSRPSSEGPR